MVDTGRLYSVDGPRLERSVIAHSKLNGSVEVNCGYASYQHPGICERQIRT